MLIDKLYETCPSITKAIEEIIERKLQEKMNLLVGNILLQVVDQGKLTIEEASAIAGFDLQNLL